jgi:predicted hydrocarbon binding protein
MADEEKMTTNIAIRAAIETITEIMGVNGARIIFRNAGVEKVFDNPPPFDFGPCFPTRFQTQIFIEVEALVGLKGALSLWRRLGYGSTKAAHEIGHLFDAYKDLPPDEKFDKCLDLFSKAVGKGKVAVGPTGRAEFDGFDCTLCSPYYNQGVDRSVCYVYTGCMQFVADFAYGKGVKIIVETKCKAKGDETCYYELQTAEK